MDENLAKLRQAIGYAKEQKAKFQGELDDATSSSGEAGRNGDTDQKELHDEHIDGLNKRITYLDEEIGKMEDAVKQIEDFKSQQETQNNTQENTQEETQARGR